MSCAKTGGPLGFVLSPFHKQLSNVHGIRVYGSKHYPSRDPVTYVLEGRVDPGSPWQLISEGDFPWINQSNPPRNPSRKFMYSTYENGDSSRTFTEVVIPAHDGAYLEYKVTVTTRTSSESELKFAEIELPGDVLSKVTTYEAEDQTVVSGEIQSLYGVSYVTLAGAYVEFPNVDGGSGGNCVLSVNYSNSRSGDRPIEVSVNGNVVGTLIGAPTMSAADWNNEIIETTCAPGMNSIRLTGIASSGPNVNKLVVYLDRMDLLTGTTNTPQPTNQPTTSAPTNLPTPKVSKAFQSRAHFLFRLTLFNKKCFFSRNAISANQPTVSFSHSSTYISHDSVAYSQTDFCSYI